MAASWTLLAARASLRITPLRRARLAGVGAEGPCPVAPDPRLLRIFAQATAVQATWCLPRALALASFLGAHGTRTRLQLGARPSPWRDGHAWLEWDGGVLGEAPGHVARFTPLVWARRA